MNTAGYCRKDRLSRLSFQGLAMIAWNTAPMQTASSTRVHTPTTRNSRVGTLQLGRRSHQILLALGMEPVSTSEVTVSSNSLQEPRVRGMPVRGKERKTTLRYDFRPVRRPSQNGELVDKASTCGRK